jgi:hypothetical protein
MYWWRIGRLKAMLKRGPLPGRIAFQYVVAQAILIAFAAMLPGAWPLDLHAWLVRAATLGVTVCGIGYCYVRNGGGVGDDFMNRYFSIAWVVNVRLSALLFASFACSAAIGAATKNDEHAAVLQSILSVSWIGLSYYRIGVHMGDVSQCGSA